MICCLHKSNASCTRSMLDRSHLTLQCMISNRAFFCNWQISHLSLQLLRTAKQGMSRLAMPLSWMMLPGRRFTPAGVQAQRILDQLQQTPIVVRPLFLTRHIVLALTVPASPLSIEALLQPLSPPYWLCQDHRVLSRRYHHHQYLSNHHHQGFLHHHHHIPAMACLFMFVSQFCGIPIPDWALSWQLCSN